MSGKGEREEFPFFYLFSSVGNDHWDVKGMSKRYHLYWTRWTEREPFQMYEG